MFFPRTQHCHAIVAALIAATLSFSSHRVLSEELLRPGAASVALANMSLADLEDAFWTCDYIATTRGPVGDVARCTAVYDALKARKFVGDYDELVRWWWQNKPARFAQLEANENRPR